MMNKFWTLRPGEGIESLKSKTAAPTELAPGSVRVNIQSCSINSRDLMVAFGQSPMPVGEEIIPLSDASGIVEETGEGVSKVAPGDRVVITFNPLHQNGSFEGYMAAGALGELAQGVLAKQAVFDQMALVKLPDNLSFEQAACLPCVAVTAWNALFESGNLMPGQTALITGTGMVSLAALQLAKAAGARVGITSGEDEKIERAKQLGADFGINYRKYPDWDTQVLDKTDGEGAHVVVETAGPPTIATSIKATAIGGRVMQIGLKGLEGPPINVLDLLVRQVKVLPIMVGSRAMLEKVVTCFSANNLAIPIERSFTFEEVPQAFTAFASGGNFGKTIISTS